MLQGWGGAGAGHQGRLTTASPRAGFPSAAPPLRIKAASQAPLSAGAGVCVRSAGRGARPSTEEKWPFLPRRQRPEVGKLRVSAAIPTQTGRAGRASGRARPPGSGGRVRGSRQGLHLPPAGLRSQRGPREAGGLESVPGSRLRGWVARPLDQEAPTRVLQHPEDWQAGRNPERPEPKLFCERGRRSRMFWLLHSQRDLGVTLSHPPRSRLRPYLTRPCSLHEARPLRVHSSSEFPPPPARPSQRPV